VTKEVVLVLTVQCPTCKKTRDIKPGEIDKNDFPICDVCFMPMMPKHASVERKKK
jgi:hypothetical protein